MNAEPLFFDKQYFSSIEGDNKEDTNSLINHMVAIGKPFFRGDLGTYRKFGSENKGKLVITITDLKLFYMALTKVKWAMENGTFDVVLKTEEVCEILKIEKDRHAYSNIRKACEHLAKVSWIAFSGKDREKYNDGFLVTGSEGLGEGRIAVSLNGHKFGFLFENLLEHKDFLTMWVNDIYRLNSTSSYLLYEDLRAHSDTRITNVRFYEDNEIKELFKIPLEGKGSYMHTVNNTLQFNRSEFERKILNPASWDIAECDMICLQPQGHNPNCDRDIENVKDKKDNYIVKENFLFYRKVKEKGKVVGYEFKYKIKPKRKNETENYSLDEDE